MISIEYRHYIDTDKPQILELIRADKDARLHLDCSNTPSNPYFRTDYYNIFLVAVSDSKIIGFAKMEFIPGSNTANLSQVYVSPTHRKIGVYSKLFELRTNLAIEQWPITRFRTLTINNPIMENILHSKGFENRGTYKAFLYFDKKYYDQTLFIKSLK